MNHINDAPNNIKTKSYNSKTKMQKPTQQTIHNNKQRETRIYKNQISMETCRSKPSPNLNSTLLGLIDVLFKP